MDENDFRSRQWRHLKTFDDWLECWDAAETIDVGLALLHRIFEHQRWRDERTLAFLLDTADWRKLAAVHPECVVNRHGTQQPDDRCAHGAHLLQRKASEMIVTCMRDHGHLTFVQRWPENFAGMLQFLVDCRDLDHSLERLRVERGEEGMVPVRFMWSNNHMRTGPREWLYRCVNDYEDALNCEAQGRELGQGALELLNFFSSPDHMRLLYQAVLAYDSHDMTFTHSVKRSSSPTMPSIASEALHLIVKTLTGMAFAPIPTGEAPKTWEEAYQWPHGLNAKAALRCLELIAKYTPESLSQLTGEPRRSES